MKRIEKSGQEIIFHLLFVFHKSMYCSHNLFVTRIRHRNPADFYRCIFPVIQISGRQFSYKSSYKRGVVILSWKGIHFWKLRTAGQGHMTISRSCKGADKFSTFLIGGKKCNVNIFHGKSFSKICLFICVYYIISPLEKQEFSAYPMIFVYKTIWIIWKFLLFLFKLKQNK